MKAFYEFPTCVGNVGARSCACLENQRIVPTRVNVEKDISVQGNQNHPGEPGNYCAAARTSVSPLLHPPA